VYPVFMPVIRCHSRKIICLVIKKKVESWLSTISESGKVFREKNVLASWENEKIIKKRSKIQV